MQDVVIIDAKRTAFGKFLGSIKDIPAAQLGTSVIKNILTRFPQIDSTMIDEVIMGQVLQAGCGQNPARQSAIGAGIAVETPSLTINKLCGSGMKAVHYAMQAIALGDADIVLAGGQENMSQSPHLLLGSRDGNKMGHWNMTDSMLSDGLTCALSDYIHMGITAENLAEKYNISRDEQDEYALMSQRKASDAQNNGHLAKQICAVHIPQRKGNDIIFEQDEFIRHNITIDDIKKPRPAFKKDGTVTAANASGINDGAAVLLIMSAKKAQELNLKPLARLVAGASAGVEPTIMGFGPVPAVKKCLKKANWSIDDLELIESNEAFAAQSLSVAKALEWNNDIVNVNGGAIAIGHPIGASGGRILTALLHEMIARNAKKGLATMCIGGGQGIATAIELL